MSVLKQIELVVEEVRRRFAPDPRTEVFEVSAVRRRRHIVLSGAVTSNWIADELLQRLRAVETPPIIDEMVRLPEEEVDGLPYAIVTAVAAPMVAGPIISAPPMSQLPMGQVVVVLRARGRWLQCRSADGNIGWIHRGYLGRIGSAEAEKWQPSSAADMHVSLGCEVLDRGTGTPIRLPWMALLMRRGPVAELPNGRHGEVRGETVHLGGLPDRFPRIGAAVVATAREWRSAPYVWGGTTPWGVDCSGLVQSVYRLHGIDMPRDSDQQARLGDEIPAGREFSNLRPGDLLYFAEGTSRISHVAISTGGARIIHAALGSGGVDENDLLERRDYEQELRSWFVCARRIIPGW